MRQILVDHARQHATIKRGNQPIHFSIDEAQIPIEQPADSLVALAEALQRLESLDETQAKASRCVSLVE